MNITFPIILSKNTPLEQTFIWVQENGVAEIINNNFRTMRGKDTQFERVEHYPYSVSRSVTFWGTEDLEERIKQMLKRNSWQCESTGKSLTQKQEIFKGIEDDLNNCEDFLRNEGCKEEEASEEDVRRLKMETNSKYYQ